MHTVRQLSRRLHLPTVLLLGAAAACHPSRVTPDAGDPSPRQRVRAWVTTADRSRLLSPLALERTSDDGRPDAAGNASGSADTVQLDTLATYQTMAGFGAALTDASVIVLGRLAPAARAQLLRELFTTDHGGIGLSALRVTIGASDFSPTHYTLDDVDAERQDTALTNFSFARDVRLKVPMLRDVRALNPRLVLMATPWSAPAWMKSSGLLTGGTLRAEMMPVYARYLLRAVQSYSSERVPLDFLSVQNEPEHEPTDYPGMRLSSSQRAQLIGQYVGPLFARRGVRTQLLEWDHNWDMPIAPLAVLADSVARRYVRGVAWHCYAGDVSAQSAVHDAYPAIETYFTECSGGEWAPNFGDNLLWNVRTLLIGATRNWASSVMLWNLALDERHGPHRGGCNDCRGVVSIDSVSGDVTRNEEYYALAHASRFVRRDAVRIGSRGAPRLAHVAFRNADDGSIVLLAVNSEATSVSLRIVGGTGPIAMQMPPRSVVTVVMPRR